MVEAHQQVVQSLSHSASHLVCQPSNQSVSQSVSQCQVRKPTSHTVSQSVSQQAGQLGCGSDGKPANQSAAFVPFFRNKFHVLFPDFLRTPTDFSRTPNFTSNSFIPKISKSILQFFLVTHALKILLLEFSKFPGLSRPIVFSRTFQFWKMLKQNPRTFQVLQDPHEPQLRSESVGQAASQLVVSHLGGQQVSQSFSLSLSNENAMTHFICSLYLFRISELILSSAGQLTSQCLSQPISQSVSRPASQLANLSVYQLVSQQAKESDNHTANYSVSH